MASEGTKFWFWKLKQALWIDGSDDSCRPPSSAPKNDQNSPALCDVYFTTVFKRQRQSRGEKGKEKSCKHD